MNKDNIGIKVDEKTLIVKIYPIIKKYREVSISILKSEIYNHNYLIKGEYSNRFDLKKIIACYYELKSIGVIAELYELDDTETTIDFFENLNKMYDGISEEIDSDES